jgi:hypothetical protein
MAKYQVKAMLNAPSEEGYNQANDPKVYGDYQILSSAFEHNNMDVMQFVLNNYRYEGGAIEEHNKDVNVLIEGNGDCFILLEKIDDKLSQANDNIAELVNRFVSLKTMNDDNCFKCTLFNEEGVCTDDISCGMCNHLTKERYRKMLMEKYIVK